MPAPKRCSSTLPGGHIVGQDQDAEVGESAPRQGGTSSPSSSPATAACRRRRRCIAVTLPRSSRSSRGTAATLSRISASRRRPSRPFVEALVVVEQGRDRRPRLADRRRGQVEPSRRPSAPTDKRPGPPCRPMLARRRAGRPLRAPRTHQSRRIVLRTVAVTTSADDVGRGVAFATVDWQLVPSPWSWSITSPRLAWRSCIDGVASAGAAAERRLHRPLAMRGARTTAVGLVIEGQVGARLVRCRGTAGRDRRRPCSSTSPSRRRRHRNMPVDLHHAATGHGEDRSRTRCSSGSRSARCTGLDQYRRSDCRHRLAGHFAAIGLVGRARRPSVSAVATRLVAVISGGVDQGPWPRNGPVVVGDQRIAHLRVLIDDQAS